MADNNDLSTGIKSTSKKPTRKYALLLAVTLAVAAFFIIRPASNSPEAIFANYFTLYPDLITGKNNQGKDPVLLEGMSAYSNHDFTKAASLLQTVLDNDPEHFTTALYLGIIHMQLKQYVIALQYLEIADENPFIEEQVSWYRALANLANGSRVLAIDQFKIIANDRNHYRRTAAREILDKLE